MHDVSSRNTLIVFAKYPEPGKVKTRLAEDLGAERAAAIYSYMAETVINNVCNTANYWTEIFFDPPEKDKEIRSWLGNTPDSYLPQQGHTLGEKISNAFRTVFSGVSDRAVIIGTDCVDVSADTVAYAFECLRHHDLVVGPADDGGYYLLGLKSYEPEIFRNIDWSTDQVLKQTIERIKERGLSFFMLETLMDIDTVFDLGPEFSTKAQGGI
ncbi:MAG: TIGR04282 family arsenosugar biosynthesis glycosyltransferase [Deltaproteobacteria bacterium]